MRRKTRRNGWSRAQRATLVIAALLALTADDRHAGKVSDGRQVIGTAVALVETGEIGLAKGAPRAVDRGSDAVSRYGIGASLVQVPAAFFAPVVEKRFGPGTSQPLFLVAPFLAVLLAAGAAGSMVRLAGGSDAAQAVTVLLTALGSPLGAYATSDFSEALQAAALGVALALALGATREESARRSTAFAAGAGAAAAFALLLKSSLAGVSPFLLLPLAAPSPLRRRRLLSGALGAAAPLAVWLVFEIVRFGRPFAGYPGEGFSHPLADGLWRLLVGPNRGFLLFFPAVALAAVGLVGALRRVGDTPLRLAAASSLAASLVLLGTAATWWAWHGVGGWGPRLLVPSVPLLAPWAGLVAAGLPARPLRLLVGLSILLNLPPLLSHPSLVDTYVANCRRGPMTAAFEREIPALAVEPDDSGQPSVPPDQALATVPAASPFVLYPWHLAASASGSPSEVATKLQRPPWYAAHPGLGPRLVPFPPELAVIVAPPPRWNFLGRSLVSGLSDPASGSVYLGSLSEQVLRAHDTARFDRALELAEKLARLWPGETSDAFLVESLRLLGRTGIAELVLRSLPRDRSASPPVLVVRALLARDRGDLGVARRFGEAAAPYFPSTLLQQSAGNPAAWPQTFSALTRSEPGPEDRPRQAP